MRSSLLLSALILPLVGCSDRTATPSPAPSNAVAVTEVVPPDESVPVMNEANETEPANASAATIGGDGSAITLAALGSGDGDGLEGELGCRFSEKPGGPALLIGRANAGSGGQSYAAVRNSGVLEMLAAPGGFGTMEKGVSFSGKGLTISVQRRAKAPTGNESSAYQADLLVQRADGAERRIQGLWTCGP
jgi:hypothetical protein